MERFLTDQGVHWWPLNRNNISLECPFCDLDRGRGHFNVSTFRPIYHCYRCGKSGHYIGLVMKLGRVPFEEAQSLVLGSIHFREDRLASPSQKLQEIELPARSYWTIGTIEYLEKRRFWPMAEEVGAYPCDEWPYKNRVIFPIVVNGVTVSYQGRTLVGACPKYRVPDGALLGKILYGLDWLTGKGPVVLVEGVFDCLRLWQSEIQAVATFGAKVSMEQIKLLKDQGVREATLLMDADVPPSKLRHMFDNLSNTFRIKLACLPEGDPADYKDVPGILNRATSSYTEYCIQRGLGFATTTAAAIRG